MRNSTKLPVKRNPTKSNRVQSEDNLQYVCRETCKEYPVLGLVRTIVSPDKEVDRFTI